MTSLSAPNSPLRTSVVAFADALGTGASTTQVHTALEFLSRLMNANSVIAERTQRLATTRDVNVSWFSDSIVMSCELESSDNLLSVLEELASIQANYALHGVFLRGSVTRGLHCHGSNLDYGPALVAAVKAEALAGNTTRIIVLDDLRYDVTELLDKPPRSPPIVEDLRDGLYFLDFISLVDTASWGRLRGQIAANYASAGSDSKAMAKLSWLAAYFNWSTNGTAALEFASDHDFCPIHRR